MQDIRQETLNECTRAEQSASVVLWEIDLTEVGGDRYFFCNEQNEKGESVRKDAKFDKQYLEGKYGADPYLRRIIDWGKVNA